MALGFQQAGLRPIASASTTPSHGPPSHAPGQPSPAIRTSACSQRKPCKPTASRAPKSYAAVSPARTSAPPAAPRVSTASAAGCGTKCYGWCANADPIGWSLRMSLRYASAARTGSWPDWRRRATPAGRSWWVLRMPPHPTGAPGSSFWPTPLARDWRSGSATQRAKRRSCQLPDRLGGPLNPDWIEWLMGFPPGWTACAPSATPSYRTLPP